MADSKLFVDLSITVLIERMVSDELKVVVKSARIHSKLTSLVEIMSRIRYLLIDAERKQLTNRAISAWLLDLEYVTYDIDDALTDLAIEGRRHQLMRKEEESSSSSSANKLALKKIISSYSFADATYHLMYLRKMCSKLDLIITRLYRLLQLAEMLGLVEEHLGNLNVTPTTTMYETSLHDSIIVGRQHDKEELLQKLFTITDETDQGCSVLAIVGMGGIGKTTMALLLYNDIRVKDHFELKAWVCVSDDFDVFNITKAIYLNMGGEDNRKFETLIQLQRALSEKLSKKRFLVVLDDVWNENYDDWELLQRPFFVGAPGSKVLVTTRKTTVASVVDAVQTSLKIFSFEEALSLLAKYALGKQNFDSDPSLELVGVGIVNKCGGLPLALKALGSVLRTKRGVEEWEEVLNSQFWDLADDFVLPALRLSYYELPPLLKQMFIYCSLFPKDYDFDKDELVLLWIAQGFLHSSGANTSLEGIGLETFQELVSKSFFQNSTENKTLYKMHDLLNDLANSLSDQFLCLSDNERYLYNTNHALEVVRYMSFTRQRFGVYSKFEAFKRAVGLRTFIALPVSTDDCQTFHISYKVLDELLPKLKLLRVLSLSNYSITRVPKSIGTLKHIRYLNFSRTNITCLPEQVSDLYDLQILLLRGCKSLVNLPKSFSKLVNLRHLDIDDTPMLKKLPSGIGGLTSLQTLSKVIIERSIGFNISMLGGLDLKGQLSIKGLHKVKNAKEAQEANIQEKKGLDNLMLEWSDVFGDSHDGRNDSEVLEKLEPHNGLRSLKILFYGGTQFPSWVGDSSFTTLTQLTLRGCESCTSLPTLGNLKSLQKLFVQSMKNVKTVGTEFLRPANSCAGIAFPSLEVLEFRHMENWEKWTLSYGGGDNDMSASSFSCLREISLVDCPKLVVQSTKPIPSVQVLQIESCSYEVLRSMVGMCPSIVTLTLDTIEGLTQLHREVLEHLGTVEYLSITKCHEMRFLWESEWEGHEILGSLQKLEVGSCKKLESLGEKEVKSGISVIKHVREVIFSNCEILKIYDCSESIERLVILNCKKLESLTFPTLQEGPSPLKIVNIQRCDSLKSDWILSNYFSSLESLEMIKLPNVKTFPEGPFDHLTRLIISGCDYLESIPEKDSVTLPFCCLRYLEIISCKNLKSFPHQLLPTFTSLEELLISDCPCMDYSFPCGLWPPNLRSLRIGRLRKPMSKWGLQSFPPSLVNLCLIGENSGVDSFASAGDATASNNSTSSFPLPSTVTILEINGFRTLESLSDGLQHLTNLQQLVIDSCPNLNDLPESLLHSLSSLKVYASLKLQERCRTKKGDYWRYISHIPELDV